jgi:intracellular sulfur oxidation DsrE/DsrF family protein
MSDQSLRLSVPRRSFLSRVSAALALVGVPAGAISAEASQAAPAAPWQPARHPADDWLEQAPGRHRLVFDTTTPGGAAQAIGYATNFFTANMSGYGLTDSDVAIVIVLRHHSTPFAYGDAIWKKYGAPLVADTGFVDPKTQQTPTVNIYNTSGYPMLPSRGTTMEALAKRGARFAVCQMATRRLAGVIASSAGGKTDDVYAELVANLVPNGHMVPAGIVTVSRAQERGYTFAVTE